MSAIRVTRTLAAMLALSALIAVQGSAQEIATIAVTDLDGYLELGYRFRDEERTRSTAASSFATEETRLYERLKLSMDGYIVHPRFIEFLIGPEVEYLRKNTKTTGSPDQDFDPILVGGEFRLTLLKDHPYSFSLFAHRSEDDVDSIFRRSYILDRQSFGGTFRSRNGPIPFAITYTHTETKGSGTFFDLDEASDNVSFKGRYTLSARSKGTLNYDFSNIDQKTFGRTVENHRALVSNITLLGQEDKVRLTGFIRASDQSGTFESSTFGVQESVFWKHSQTLSSRYDARYDRRDTGADVVDTWQASLGLDHRLYESLNSSLSLAGTRTSSSFDALDEYRGDISESYTKRLGEWGNFLLSPRVFTEYQDIDARQDVGEVRDEPIVISSLTPAPFAQSDIMVSSIVVTDSVGAIIYVEGVDYTLIQTGRQVLILRLTLGAIAEGDTVLVNYRYDIGGDRTTLTTGGLIISRISWQEWLALTGQFERRREKRIAGTPTVALDELTRWAVALDGTWRWLLVGANYEDRVSTFTPYRAFSQRFTATFVPLPRWQMRYGAAHESKTFLDSNDDIDTWDVQGGWTVRITHRTHLELEAEYRQQRWNSLQKSNDLDAVTLRSTAEWRAGKLIASAYVFFSQVDQFGQTEDLTRFEMALRREF